MRKTFSMFAVIAAIIVTPPAHAESWYGGVYGGTNFTHDGSVNGAGTEASYDIGLAAGGYVGFFVQKNVRIEAELLYRTNDIDTVGGVAAGGKAEALGLMANALIDFKTGSSVHPYLGAGLGFADVNYSTGDDTVLGVQMIAGAGIDIAPATQLTVDYRLFVTENLATGAGLGYGDVEYVNSAIVIGLKRTF